MTTQNTDTAGDRPSNHAARPKLPLAPLLFHPLASAAAQPDAAPDSTTSGTDSDPAPSGLAHDKTVRSIESAPGSRPKQRVPDDESETIERRSSVMGKSGPLPALGASTQELDILTDLTENPSAQESKPPSNKGGIVPPSLPRSANLTAPEPKHSVAPRAGSSIPSTRAPNTPRSGSSVVPEPADPPTLETELFISLIQIDDKATEYAKVDTNGHHVHSSPYLMQFIHLGRHVQESRNDAVLKARYRDARCFALAELLMRDGQLALGRIEEEDLSGMLMVTRSLEPADPVRAQGLTQARIRVQKHLEQRRRPAESLPRHQDVRHATAPQQPGQPAAAAPPPANAPTGGGAAAPPPPAPLPVVQQADPPVRFRRRFRSLVAGNPLISAVITIGIVICIFYAVSKLLPATMQFSVAGIDVGTEWLKKVGDENKKLDPKPTTDIGKIAPSPQTSSPSLKIIEAAQYIGDIGDACLLVARGRVSSRDENHSALSCREFREISVPDMAGPGTSTPMTLLCGCHTP